MKKALKDDTYDKFPSHASSNNAFFSEGRGAGPLPSNNISLQERG